MPRVSAGVNKLPSKTTESQVLSMRNINPDYLDKVMQGLRAGRIYRPRAMSRSATLVKQDSFLLEIQDKSSMKKSLSFPQVIAEVG